MLPCPQFHNLPATLPAVGRKQALGPLALADSGDPASEASMVLLLFF